MILFRITNSDYIRVFGASVDMPSMYIGADPYEPRSATGLLYAQEADVCIVSLRIVKRKLNCRLVKWHHQNLVLGSSYRLQPAYLTLSRKNDIDAGITMHFAESSNERFGFRIKR